MSDRRVIAWDCETYLFKPYRMAPKVVCLSWDDGEHSGLETGDGIERWLHQQLDGDALLMGHVVSYDAACVLATFPSVWHKLWRAYEHDRITCTAIREKLLDIAVGEFRKHQVGLAWKKHTYHLADLAERRLKVTLAKGEDTWRLRYAELDGVPLEQWPKEAVDYAVGDAVTTRALFMNQAERAGRLSYSLPTQFDDVRADFALRLASVWGIETDQAQVQMLWKQTIEQMQGLAPELIASGLAKGLGEPDVRGVPKIRKSMIALRAMVEQHYPGGDPPKTPKGAIKTSRDVVRECSFEPLQRLSEFSRLQKIASTYLSKLFGLIVHPRFDGIGAASDRTSSSGPNCLSADTEILTEFGWLLLPQARKIGARPFQYNSDTGEASLAPTAEYVMTSSCSWVHVETQAIDHFCTADHRMLVECAEWKNGKALRTLKTLPACELPANQASLLSRSCSLAEGGEVIAPCKIVVLCACQADGWRRKYGKGEAWAFYFSKKRKSQRLIAALTACGDAAVWHTSPVSRKDEKRRNQVAVYLKDCPIKAWVDLLLGFSKMFGLWLLGWTNESLRLFVDEVTQWDGRADRRNEYSTVVKGNADWVQAIAMLVGVRAGKVREFWGSKSKIPCYQVSAGREFVRMGFSRKHITETVCGEERPAYCATVPTGYIFVRRNGKACITGNCQNQPRLPGLRECFKARDGYVFLSCDFDSQEMRTLAQTCLDIVGYSRLAERYQADRHFDPHLEFAAMLAGISVEEAAKRKADGNAEIKELRQRSKCANFGNPGGMGPDKFVQYARGYGLTLSREEAYELRENWFLQWPEMRDYFRGVENVVGPAGLGRQIIPRSGFIRGGCDYCNLANGYFQTLAAHASKAAMFAVCKRAYCDRESALYGSRPVVFVHDEVILETPEEAGDIAAKEIVQVMEEAMQKWTPDVPVAASAVLMRRWSKAAEPTFSEDGRLIPWEEEEPENQ